LPRGGAAVDVVDVVLECPVISITPDPAAGIRDHPGRDRPSGIHDVLDGNGDRERFRSDLMLLTGLLPFWLLSR
jgi:hypothetical protein